MSSLRNKPLIRVAAGGRPRGHGWSLTTKKPRAHYAASLENVRRVSKEVRDLLRRNTEKELRPEMRASHRFYDDIIKLQDRLDMTEDDDETTLEALEAARDTVFEASEDFQKLPDVNRFVRTAAVAKLSAIRGLETKDQIQQYLEDVDVLVNWRLGRAEHAQKVKDEGYTDRKGKERSPAELAAKAERDAARRANPMASRLSPVGQGRQDAATNSASMRSLQDRRIEKGRRQRKAIKRAHAARNAEPPPPGAFRHVDGYIVQPHIAQELFNPADNPATWNRPEIERRVAEFRERNGVPELDRNVYGTYVSPKGDGYEVQPPVRMRRLLRMKGDPKQIYCAETRSGKFPDKNEADVALEKFMSPSTSDDERKAMLRRPREAFICAHCGRDFFKGWGKDEGKCLVARQSHERLCPERSSSSSSEEEESDEDESEEEESEEVVAPPPPKRSRFSWLWPSSA